MKKHALLFFSYGFVVFTGAFAGTYEDRYFIIHSDLDPRYVNFVRDNAEAYYNGLKLSGEGFGEGYFPKGWSEPLVIYYSGRQADTQRLLKEHGLDTVVGDVKEGCYVGSVPAIYAHRLMDDGSVCGWEPFFRSIACHFIRLNYENPPAWFKEGLSCFLTEQTRLVECNFAVRLVISRRNPWREQILRDRIEQGDRPDIKRLFSLSSERFYEWDTGCHFARELFYWLNERGKLKKYLANVRERGYQLAVLEETLSESFRKLNVEFAKFIKQDCYAGAYLKDGQQAENRAEKRQAILKALELKPEYRPALLELAWCYYRDKDYEKARENLALLLSDSESIEYAGAAKLAGLICYNQKDYENALEYYRKVLGSLDYNEYGYELYYLMANCQHYLADYAKAVRFYKKFLDNNWEPERLSKEVKYAKEYLAWHERKRAKERKYIEQEEEQKRLTIF